MSYELEIQNSFPVAFHSLNGTRPPLVAGSGSSTLMTAPTSQTFAAWVKDREDSPFSIEAWFLPMSLGGAADLLVFGHSTEDEGVFYDGSGYFLRIKFAGQTLEGRWNDPEIKARHLAMTYDVGSVNLYVDGERAISLATPSDQFIRDTGSITLNSGGGSGVYDALALYYRALPVSEIKEHFALGRAVSSSVSIASSKGATTWTLAYADVDVFQTITYSADSWDVGCFTDVSHTDRLEADAAGGTWQVAIPLSAMVSPTIAGVHLRFVGETVVMEWSTDAVTWQGIENKTTVLEDADTTDLTLFVRLTLINEDSWVESLTADLLGERVMQPFSGNRQLVFNNAEMDHTPGIQLEYQSDMGAKLVNGYLDIQPDSGPAPVPVSAIEIWFKLDQAITATNTVLIHNEFVYMGLVNGGMNASAPNIYLDGVALTGNTTLSPGIWYHMIINSHQPTNARIAIGSNLGYGESTGCSIGHVAVYPTQLTAAQAKAIYDENIGAPALRVDDDGGFSLSESSTPYDIYAYAWSIVGGSN